jgi:amino acid transporter
MPGQGVGLPILDVILGRPLASSEEGSEKIGVAKGVPVFGLDALGSAAYGPEAALTLLIPLGVAGLAYIVPLSFVIIGLLAVVFFSYRQTIAAYPKGGGSYTVAHQNLGMFPGLLAGAALLIDYTLDAAVGISAGVAALTSAFPWLHPWTLSLCLAALALLTVVNLRGVRENGSLFLAPTYLFLGCMAIVTGAGLYKVIVSGGHPHPIVAPPVSHATVQAISWWLLIKAFAGGCTALTGVEAISNGVQAFREDRVKLARRTLAIIIAALGGLLAGIAYLVKAYGIVATDPAGKNYQSILSMLLGAVVGRGWFYYVAIAGILLVLIFSANTAFADFPRVCRYIAEDRYLPNSFSNRGRRLVYTEGIVVLAVITGVLLTAFGGITDRLIPLFAIGAFLAFTMSQAAMVAHWRREGGEHARKYMLVNGVGALGTGITVVIVAVAKFREGAWITLIAVPALMLLMAGVHRHYERVQGEIESDAPLEVTRGQKPLIVISITRWSRISKQALSLALTLSDEIKVVHVREEESKDDFCDRWQENVLAPLTAADAPVPELVELRSPYRFVVGPIVDYVRKLAADHPERRVVTIIPELVEDRWYYYFLHTQRATLLKTQLLMAGNDRISVLNIPLYLKGR